LKRELAATRRRGYGINSNESAPGINAVGQHVSGPDGTVFGALVVATPNARCPHGRLSELARQLAEIVKDLEADLSSELSAAPPAGRV
jgi:DNA-binding IclR family transcriptional regulator